MYVLFWKPIHIFLTFPYLLISDWQELEDKDIPDPIKLVTEYSMVYESELARLQQDAQADLLWFICKVMPAIQKIYKQTNLGRRAKTRLLPSCNTIQ